MERPTPSQNVFYDSASKYRWSDLLERDFLERVIAELRNAMGKDFERYSFFVFSARDPDVQPASLSDPSPRKVLIFITDESGLVPVSLRTNYFAIFKLFMARYEPGQNVFPFNLGYLSGVQAGSVKPVENRRISVFFAGQLHIGRISMYRALHPLYRRLPPFVCRVGFHLFWRGLPRNFEAKLIPGDLSRAFPGSVLNFTRRWRQGLSPEQYGAYLAQSRIVLCPPGIEQPETHRHIEAFRAGAIVVSEALPDTHFYRGAPIVAVKDWKTGVTRVRALLDDPAALRELQQTTIQWWENVCSEWATARYMQAKLESLPGQPDEKKPN